MDQEEEFEDEEYAEEFEDVILPEEEVAPDSKPELKRLYQQHPECNLDYMEQVIPKIPLTGSATRRGTSRRQSPDISVSYEL
jgi:hypothetical protein